MKRLLQERWRIPYQQNWEEITEVLKRKLPTLPVAEVESFIKGLTAILEKKK
ncbi:hypothetical protein ACI2OX_03400 [Bacillus sp. N9]